MSGNKSLDDTDLPWPLPRGELDELETLELGRDAAGKPAWQNMTPPGHETYRGWMPRRAKGTPPAPPPDDVADVWGDDPLASLFASEATSGATREAGQPTEAAAAPTLGDWVEPSLTDAPAPSTEPLPELPLKDQVVSVVVSDVPATFLEEGTAAVVEDRLDDSLDAPTAPDEVTPASWIPLPQSSTAASIPSPSTRVAGPPRLSLALTQIEGQQPVRISLPPITRQARTRVERLALLGTGAVIGVMASMVFGGAWRPDERPASAAADRPSSAPREVTQVPLATPAVPVPAAQLATVDAPAPPPAATDIAPVPASPPAQVAAAAPSSRAAAPARSPARESGATATATRPAASPAPIAPTPIAAPPEVLVTVDRFAAAYNRMDASATQAVWPTADRQALVTTFTAIREQRLTLSRCRGTMQGDTAIVLCRGTLRYRPRVGDHDTRTVEGNWRFTMLQRADDWVVENVESP